MSEEKHFFQIKSAWIGTSDGDGAIEAVWGEVGYGVPAALGGKPGRANPEELLLSALVACYSITLAHLAERRRLPMTQIEVDVEGEVERLPDRSLQFATIRLHPKMTLTGSDAAQQQAALDCAHKAELYCIVSRAIKGNVEIVTEPEIVTA